MTSKGFQAFNFDTFAAGEVDLGKPTTSGLWSIPSSHIIPST